MLKDKNQHFGKLDKQALISRNEKHIVEKLA